MRERRSSSTTAGGRDRGQLYTLEGVIAGLVLLLGILFALQATVATPSSAGSLNPHAEQQSEATVRSALLAANDTQLRQAVLFWNPDEQAFQCTPDGVTFYPGTANIDPSPDDCNIDSPSKYDDRVPPNEFGRMLGQRLGPAFDYNVYVVYPDRSGELQRQRMVFQGQPGTGAVRTSTSVALTNDQRVYEETDDLESPSGDQLKTWHSDSDILYAPPMEDGTTGDGDDAQDDDLYSVVYVEVVAWR